MNPDPGVRRSDALREVQRCGDLVAAKEVLLHREKVARNRAIRVAVAAGVPVTKVAAAAHVSRDWVYKIADGADPS